MLQYAGCAKQLLGSENQLGSLVVVELTAALHCNMLDAPSIEI